MNVRVDLQDNPVTTAFMRHLAAADRALHDSGVPGATRELVKIRASQINGCGFCVDMHSKDAARAGETQQRLILVAAWREATVFTAAERAALELTEQGTRLADASTGVSDDVWLAAAVHYSDDDLAVLVALIANINAWNRLSVIARLSAGDYQPAGSGEPAPAGTVTHRPAAETAGPAE
jgi:AhpD family alkylhydroperoxidase